MTHNAKSSYERIQQLLQEEEDDDRFGGNAFTPDYSTTTALEIKQPVTTQVNSNLTAKDIEIKLFHDKLQHFVDKFGLLQAPSLEEFSDLTTEYAVQIDGLRIQAKEAQQLVLTSNRSNIVEQERRSERDFWSLLQVMSISDVMGVVEDTRCQQSLENSLSNLSPLVTIPDYLNTAFSSDLRFKKAKVIKDWLENAYRDQVVDIPAPRSPPMFETWMAIQQMRNHGGNKMDIVRGKSQLSNINPDCQLHSAGLLSLVGSDQQDQEAMLLCIWQLIRSGQIDEAQRKAYEHQAYWLASSLRGVDPHWYSTREHQRSTNMDDEYPNASVSLMRRGNVRHGLSMQNAYHYAENLLHSLRKSAKDVSIASYATVLEMSIYAVLANHVAALKESQLIASWSDRLWVHVNGIYNRDLIKIYQLYYDRKSEHSRYYPGCDEKTIETNKWLSNEFSRHVEGNLDDQIDQAISAPPTKNLECILRQLQIAFLGGVKSIKRYFDAHLLGLIEPQDVYPGYEHVLRIVVHVLLWCGLSPTTLSAPLDQVVSQEMYYHTLEIYINHLILQGHYELVALYVRFLSPHRRVVAYARLLLAIQSDHVHQFSSSGSGGVTTVPLSRHERDMWSRKALSLAQQYFPDDLADITRTVMEDSNKPTSLLQLRPQAPVSVTADGKDSSASSVFFSPNKSTKHTPSSSQALVVVSDSQVAAQSAVPSIPSEADRLVLESLRWVVLESSSQQQAPQDISKAVEVLRAVHRVVISLLLESHMEKVSLLPIIMDNYATEEILLRVDQQIDHLRVQQQLLLQEGDDNAQKTSVYEAQWSIDKNIYSLWQVLRLVYQRREEWLDCLRFIRIEQQKSLGQIDASGRFTTGLPPMELYHHLRNLVLDELLPLIESIFETNVSDGQQQGLVTVMQDAIASATEVSESLLQEVVHLLQGATTTTTMMTNTSSLVQEQSVLSAQRAKDDVHLLQQLTQLFGELQASSACFAEGNPDLAALFAAPLRHIEQFLETEKEKEHPSVSSEALLRVYKLLQVVVARWKDILDTQKVLSLLVYYLLQMYVSICLRSNEALSLFETLRDAGVAETHTQILVRAFHLSDMIAHEARTLGLYCYLTTEQLELLLEDIGKAAFYLLPNGPGSLSVPSPLLT